MNYAFYLPFLLLISGVNAFASSSQFVTIPSRVMIDSGLNAEFIAQFALFVAIVLLWTVFCGRFLHRFFWLPTIAGQIIGGVVLGPSLINLERFWLFTEPLQLIDFATGKVYALVSSDLFVFVLLALSSVLTVSYLLWIAGHETDIKDILKVGKTATFAGIFGALLPIIMTILAVCLCCAESATNAQALGLGIMFSATSVSIPIAMLFSRNKMHLKSSKATLGAAIIDDIFAVVLLSLFFIAIESGLLQVADNVVDRLHSSSSLMVSLGYMVFTFAVMIGAGYFGIPRAIRMLKKYKLTYLITPVATGIMLLFFSFAELVGGLAGITGAYFAGLFHRMEDVYHQAEKIISPFVNGVLLPLFLGSIGFQLDLRVLNLYDWYVVVLLLVVAIVSKLLACFMATGLSNMMHRGDNFLGWKGIESYLFGSAMVARGEVGLVIATILNGAQLITPRQYAIGVVVIVLSTIAAPVLMAIGFDLMKRYPSRDRVHDYYVNLGLFSNVGTTQMFNVISRILENSHLYKTAISFSQGRRMINLEGQNVKIILAPRKGIILEGDKEKIEEIIQIVKRNLLGDVTKLPH